MYWPELDVARGVLPRRAFLVAKHAVPALVELTWNYGRHYERHWLGESRRGRAHGGGAQGRAPSGVDAEQPGAAGGPGGGASAPLGEEAATAEAREQLLAAEELLPWGAAQPSWGARRYDWLARLHGAASAAALLAGPMHEFEAELRPWAAGEGWAAGRSAWRRRVLALAQLPAEQQGHELLALPRELEPHVPWAATLWAAGRRLQAAGCRLQPHTLQAATLRVMGCNAMWCRRCCVRYSARCSPHSAARSPHPRSARAAHRAARAARRATSRGVAS